MKKSAGVLGVAIAAISLGVGLAGCGKEEKTSSTTTTTSPTTTTSTTTTSAQAAGPNQTLDEYLKQNNIQETLVSHDTPGAPVVDIPTPDGWTTLPESEDAPYGGFELNSPSDPADPVKFEFLLEKLTGNINTDELLRVSVGDLKNQPGFDGGDGATGTLNNQPAYQIGGSYTKDGQQRIGAQKSVVIPGKDGTYLLLIIGRGPDADAQAIMDATGWIDEKTTITI